MEKKNWWNLTSALMTVLLQRSDISSLGNEVKFEED